MNLKSLTYLAALVILLILLGFALVFVKQRFGSPATVTTLPVVEKANDQLIAGFPDFPMYPGANLESSQHTEATAAPEYNSPTYQAFLDTKDSPSAVMTWYVAHLQTAGWQIVRPVDSSQTDDQNVIMSKGANVATINVEKESDEGTTISLFIK